jgi:hypothetical protein
MLNAARIVRHRLWALGVVAVAAAGGLSTPAWATCPTGMTTCGTYCVWNRQNCCDSVGHPEAYCPAGRVCNADGQHCDGSALGCASGYVAGISSCGSDSCSCVQSCTSNSQCTSGCCVTPANATSIGMFCAPSCVCQSSGALVAYCASGSGTQSDAGTSQLDGSIRTDGGGSQSSRSPSADPFGSGCVVGQGGAGIGAALFLVALALVWRSRRRS